MAALFRIAVICILVNLSARPCLAQDGEWSEVASACIRNNNHWVGSDPSFADCQRSCEEQTAFTCLSVDYRDGRCQHSRYHRTSIRPTSDFSQPCYNGQPWLWAERLDIDYAWSVVVDGCFRAHYDRIFSGVPTIEDCQQRCIDEDGFVCLSVDYIGDRAGGTCHLSRFNFDSIRPTSVYTQPCNGNPKWKYSERRDKKYYWTDTVLGCIKDHDDWAGRVSSLAECQKRCVDKTGFTCLSIDYKESTTECHLSRFNRDTLCPTSSFTQPCDESGWTYAERVDVGEWTPEVLACIRNHNIRASVAVQDLASCRLICSQDDDCCSIEYNDSRGCNLSPNNRANVDPPSDYREPCHVAGYYYSERVDKFCGY